MYHVKTTKHFEKGVKKCQKRGYDMCLLRKVIDTLAEEGKLPAKYHPHKLGGDYQGFWECHIQPDWLLLWAQNDDELLLILTDIGTHADLFK